VFTLLGHGNTGRFGKVFRSFLYCNLCARPISSYCFKYGYHLVISSLKNLVGKPEGKRPLGRPRRRWEDNIEMDLRGSGWESGFIWLRTWFSGGLLRHVNEIWGSIKDGEFLD
jgi:hypothetical protein